MPFRDMDTGNDAWIMGEMLGDDISPQLAAYIKRRTEELEKTVKKKPGQKRKPSASGGAEQVATPLVETTSKAPAEKASAVQSEKAQTPPLNPANLVPDAIPQERFTGDVLHGHGPRRGNLEKLLRYWRPIMRREGGFRRCLVILADHPELYPLENLCAWLHHETTGLWPNEGCHHPGMKNCRRKLRRVANGSLWSDADFNARMGKLRSLAGKNADMDPTTDELAVAGWALKQFCQQEPEWVSYLGDEKNWHYVGEDETGAEVEYEPQGEYGHSHDDHGDCGCGCGGTGGCQPMVVPDDEHALLLRLARHGNGRLLGRRRPLTQPEVDMRASMHAMMRRAMTRRFMGTMRPVDVIDAPLASAEPILRKFSDDKSAEVIEEKRGGLVRPLESVASYLTPGNSGFLRHPVRSSLVRLATPGGGHRGGLPGRIGGDEFDRCPVGLVGAGQFTNQSLLGCGEQIFDSPGTAAENTARATRRAEALAQRSNNGEVGGGIGSGLNTDRPGLLRARNVAAGRYIGDPIAIRRLSQIAPAGDANPEAHSRAVSSAVNAARDSKVPFARLVRADGVALDSVVSVERLSGVRSSRDMNGGALVTFSNSPVGIGRHEVGTFRTGIRSVRMVQPGGGELRLDVVKPVSPEKATQIARRMGALSQAEGPFDHGSALQGLASEFPELRYSEDFPNIDKPNEIVKIQRGDQAATAKRWAYDAFLAERAPGRPASETAWKEVDSIDQGDPSAVPTEVTTSVSEAPRRLDSGLPIDNIPAKQREQALMRSRDYKTSDLGAGRVRFDGKSESFVLRNDVSSDEALSMRVSSDVARALESNAPTVRFVGEGGGRKPLVSSPSEAVKGSRSVGAVDPKEFSTGDLLRVVLSDYMTDHRGRSFASIAGVKSGNQTRAVAMPTKAGMFVAAKTAKDQSFGEFLSALDGGEWARERIERESNFGLARQVYDALIDKASAFDWDAYLARLSLDGQLSEGEKAHIAAVRQLFAGRLEQLRASRETLAKILRGINE